MGIALKKNDFNDETISEYLKGNNPWYPTPPRESIKVNRTKDLEENPQKIVGSKESPTQL